MMNSSAAGKTPSLSLAAFMTDKFQDLGLDFSILHKATKIHRVY